MPDDTAERIRRIFGTMGAAHADVERVEVDVVIEPEDIKRFAELLGAPQEGKPDAFAGIGPMRGAILAAAVHAYCCEVACSYYGMPSSFLHAVSDVGSMKGEGFGTLRVAELTLGSPESGAAPVYQA